MENREVREDFEVGIKVAVEEAAADGEGEGREREFMEPETEEATTERGVNEGFTLVLRVADTEAERESSSSRLFLLEAESIREICNDTPRKTLEKRVNKCIII